MILIRQTANAVSRQLGQELRQWRRVLKKQGRKALQIFRRGMKTEIRGSVRRRSGQLARSVRVLRSVDLRGDQLVGSVAPVGKRAGRKEVLYYARFLAGGTKTHTIDAKRTKSGGLRRGARRALVFEVAGRRRFARRVRVKGVTANPFEVRAMERNIDEATAVLADAFRLFRAT